MFPWWQSGKTVLLAFKTLCSEIYAYSSLSKIWYTNSLLLICQISEIESGFQIFRSAKKLTISSTF